MRDYIRGSWSSMAFFVNLLNYPAVLQSCATHHAEIDQPALLDFSAFFSSRSKWFPVFGWYQRAFAAIRAVESRCGRRAPSGPIFGQAGMCRTKR